MANRFADAQPVLSGPSLSVGGLFQRKYAAMLAEAQELLRGEAQPSMVHDSLNCGKLAKLLGYLRQGSFALVICTSMAELALK